MKAIILSLISLFCACKKKPQAFNDGDVLPGFKRGLGANGATYYYIPVDGKPFKEDH